MSVIFKRFLPNLAVRAYILLKLSHASTLSIWNEKSKPRVRSKLRKQRYTVTRFDCNQLAQLVL